MWADSVLVWADTVLTEHLLCGRKQSVLIMWADNIFIVWADSDDI